MSAAPPSCSSLAPLLALCADGEASPRERLQVSLHTGRCTRCRILLAREQRLSEALVELTEVDDEALQRLIQGERESDAPVGFTERLMRQLEEPELEKTKKRLRRGLRLAVWFGLIGFILAAAGAKSGVSLLASTILPSVGGDTITLSAGRLGEVAQAFWSLLGAEGLLAAAGGDWLPHTLIRFGSLAIVVVLLGGFALLIGALTITLLATARRAA